MVTKLLSCLVQLDAEPLDESQRVDGVPHVLLKLLLTHLHQVFLQFRFVRQDRRITVEWLAKDYPKVSTS